MVMSSRSSTDPALLDRLRDPSDEQSWDEFVARYKPKIYELCYRQWKDEARADGVTREILHKLREKMLTFILRKPGSYRSWLHGFVRNVLKTQNRIDQPKGAVRATGREENRAALLQIPDPDTQDQNACDSDADDSNALVESVTAVLYREKRLRQKWLIAEAARRVKKRLRQPKRYLAFYLSKFEAKKPTEVAEELMEKKDYAFLKKKARPAGWVSVVAKEVGRLFDEQLEEIVRPLLAAAQSGEPSPELARYARRKKKQLSKNAMKLLQAELNKILEPLIKVVTGTNSVSETARDLQIRYADCIRLTDALGIGFAKELDKVEKEEAQPTDD
jgi:DNA-directed RNA polymerase specialized sigma24 family protein